MMKRLYMVLALLPVLAWAGPGMAEWPERGAVRHPAGNLAFSMRWPGAEGISLRVASTNARAAVVLDLNRKAPSIRGEPEAAVARLLLDGAQFNGDAFPTNDQESVNVVMKFRQETWSVYVDGRPVVVLPAPFAPPLAVSHAPELLPAEGRRETFFQKTDDFVFHDDFLVPEGEEDELAAWEPLAGVWTLHSVADDFRPRARPVRANPKAKARGDRKPVAARSPNFYSLIGSGTNAVLVTGYDFYDACTIEASVQVGPGEGGLVFHQGAGGYFAFTLRPDDEPDRVRLSLWRTASSNAASRTELGAVRAEIGDGQWVMLGVRTFQNRIQCFVDKTKVIDLPAELPVGGRFGLFADTDGSLLFDDVAARSNHDLDFLGVNDIRRHALVEQGQFFARRRFFNLFPPRESPFLEPPASRDPQWLILGSATHGPHVFAADFQQASPEGEYGLIAGYEGEHRPYQRLVCRRGPTNETFILESVASNGVVLALRTLSLPVAPGVGDPTNTVRLMCDATADGDLRFYRNRDLVLVQHGAKGVGGASGVYVGRGTRVRIGDPEYAFERGDLYTDQFEKNTAYLVDRFMRHWSAPEGQWEDPTNGVYWYKGDVFGRVAVHMPLAGGTAVHLGALDNATNGAWIVEVAGGLLRLRAGGDGARLADASVAAVPTNRVRGLVGPVTNLTTGYTIRAEGYWIWVTSGDELLIQQALPRPLSGRRLFVSGFTTDQLAFSRVERYNVKDFLFKESLHPWTINGGRWEVINRFQCDPRWSHMDGESTNGLAALWSKYEFHGDFCVELYAGTRMGWYERCGDYNVTVLNRDTTPSQGYTVTCTGYDYDLSQLYTKLYREGALMTQSDAYCAPRIRSGNKRKQRSALIDTGRDVHGAWYYMKFRRVGTRLEYYFDNDLVFACEDPAPLEAGSFGLWTYMNSMVVARVKIAAESVEPRALKFEPAGREPAPAASDAAGPGGWTADDPVSLARLAWHAPTNGAAPYFSVTSVLGSGTLLARCDAPPVPYPRIAGWRFEARRTERGQFNFHYSIGRRNAVGVYTPEQQWFHLVSGEDFARGSCRLSGASHVPGSAATNTAWHESGEWTPVTVWLPMEGFRWQASDTNLLVKVEGFGNLQPGYVMQGLTGNGPGEGYAIRGFATIETLAAGGRTNRQNLTCGWSATEPDTVEIRGGTGTLCRALAFADVAMGQQRAVGRFKPPALLEVPVPRTDDCRTGVVVTLSGDASITNRFELRWADASVRTPPVLARLEGLAGLYENFEAPGVTVESAYRMRVESADPVQGRYLTVFNTGPGQRLSSEFGPSLSLSRFPVLRFRYRGGPMARVSLALLGPGTVRLSEALGSARTVRGGTDLVLDDQWHTWEGVVSDGAGEQTFSPGAMTAGRIRFASADGTDQTGRYTAWALDDITAGPAVSRGAQLAFTPHFFDFEGVTRVRMAVTAGGGGDAAADARERREPAWREIANHQPVTPEIDGLADGFGRILLQARNTRGLDSQTVELPFRLHRAPPKVACAFEPATDPMGNGSVLAVNVQTAGGPPLDVEALRFRWNDREVAVTNALASRFVPGPDQQQVVLNWPLVFRGQLNEAGAGEAFTIGVANLRDGAGNTVPDVALPRRIDYAADHTPPTLLATRYPSNVFWTTGWELNSETRTFFSAQAGTTMALARKAGEAPWLSVQSGTATGGVTYAFNPRWRVRQHPFLAFRLRRPALAPDEKTRIDLALDADTNRTIIVGLTPGGAATNRVALPEPIVWASNEWASVTLDVGRLLTQAGVTGRHVTVKGMAFTVIGKTNGPPLNVQSVFVFAPWGAGDRVVLDGYDESGVSGVSWEAVQHTRGMEVEPAALAGADQGWMTMRMRDKAGNVSTPVYLPMGGRYAAARNEGP